MKQSKFIILICSIAFIGMLSTTLVSFTQIKTSETGQNIAKVEKIGNYYIFIKSEPVQEYEVLSTIKSPAIVKNTKLTTLVGVIIKKADKSGIRGNGLIFDTSTLSEAKLIKFKE